MLCVVGGGRESETIDAVGEDEVVEEGRRCIGCESGSTEEERPIRLSTERPNCNITVMSELSSKKQRN